MATIPAYEHTYKRDLPPSPPPSPPITRRRGKKKHDPFEELARTPVPSRPESPAIEASDDDESVLTKIILTPILFTSFLLSLCLVNYRSRARRAKAHPSTSSFLTYLAPLSWLDPEPYQDPADSTWDRKGASGHVQPHDALGPRAGTGGSDMAKEKKGQEGKKGKRKSWHLNKKIRKMTKMEVSDAFEMRGRVIAGMFLMGMMGVLGMWMGLRWIFALLVRVRRLVVVMMNDLMSSGFL